MLSLFSSVTRSFFVFPVGVETNPIRLYGSLVNSSQNGQNRSINRGVLLTMECGAGIRRGSVKGASITIIYFFKGVCAERRVHLSSGVALFSKLELSLSTKKVFFYYFNSVPEFHVRFFSFSLRFALYVTTFLPTVVR